MTKQKRKIAKRQNSKIKVKKQKLDKEQIPSLCCGMTTY